MEKVIVQPGLRRGRVTIPVSKSHLHRLMVADYLAGEGEHYLSLPVSADICATRRCLDALRRADSSACPTLDCGESGSTLRFLLPVAMTRCQRAQVVAQGRLPERPMAAFLDALRQHGVTCPDGFPLVLSGGLTAGEFALPGNISSQFVTGLLLALPVLASDSVIRLTSALESSGYVDMTLAVLKQYGIMVTPYENGFRIPGRQVYCRPKAVFPEADWSSAAFWLGMNALGARIEMTPLLENSAQPDRAIRQLLDRVGKEMDVSACPDCFPVLAMVAGAFQGTTTFTGVQRLRFKESDRVRAMAAVLGQFGVETRETDQAFTVFGHGTPLRGNVSIPTFHDHRIAMAAAVGASVAAGPVEIQEPSCVEKSYPDFFSQFDRLEH